MGFFGSIGNIISDVNQTVNVVNKLESNGEGDLIKDAVVGAKSVGEAVYNSIKSHNKPVPKRGLEQLAITKTSTIDEYNQVRPQASEYEKTQVVQATNFVSHMQDGLKYLHLTDKEYKRFLHKASKLGSEPNPILAMLSSTTLGVKNHCLIQDDVASHPNIVMYDDETEEYLEWILGSTHMKLNRSVPLASTVAALKADPACRIAQFTSQHAGEFDLIGEDIIIKLTIQVGKYDATVRFTQFIPCFETLSGAPEPRKRFYPETFGVADDGNSFDFEIFVPKNYLYAAMTGAGKGSFGELRIAMRGTNGAVLNIEAMKATIAFASQSGSIQSLSRVRQGTNNFQSMSVFISSISDNDVHPLTENRDMIMGDKSTRTFNTLYGFTIPVSKAVENKVTRYKQFLVENLTRLDDPEKIVDQIVAQFNGRADILYNPMLLQYLAYSPETWDQMIKALHSILFGD